MHHFMLDTDFCIRVIKFRPFPLRARFNTEAESLCISTVTWFELLYGAEKSARPAENRRTVEQFAERLGVLAWTDEAAGHAGDIRRSLERNGTPIGAYDVLIAGHARSRGLVVVTGSLGEFQRVHGLRSEDWQI